MTKQQGSIRSRRGSKLAWWGYRHINGTTHLKRYFGPDDITEAENSIFVEEVYGPWEVNRADAIERLHLATQED